MAQLTKKSPIIKIFSKASFNEHQMTETEKMDYKDAIKLIRELAANPNPMNLWELNNIVAYVVDTTIDARIDYIDLVADVKRTGFDERPKFKTKTEGVQAFWQAINGTPDKSKVGFKYSGLEIEELSAMPVAEWAEIAAGRYDFAELIRDVTNEFEAKIAQKVQNTLYSAFKGMSTPNYASGTGVVAGSFDPLLTAMQRFGGRVAIIGDFEALQKLPALTAINNSVSDNIKDEVNRNGLIGVYKGAPVVKLDNPYSGFAGYDTVLDKGLIYIVPILNNEWKTLKVQFAGEVQPMSQHNIYDRSYEMRYDKHMGAGVVDAPRHALAVYEDDSLSGF
jgi:hypothetical protein